MQLLVQGSTAFQTGEAMFNEGTGVEVETMLTLLAMAVSQF